MTSPKISEPERPVLIGSPYTTPKCKRGDWINDELVGLVEVFGWTDAPLSWPRIRRKGPPAPVLTSELARAVRTESEIAVVVWWGVSRGLVQRWRREMEVDAYTEGTRRLMREANLAMPQERRERCVSALKKTHAGARSPQVIAKRLGQPAHEATRAALIRGAKKAKSPDWGVRANAWMLAGKAKAKNPN